MALNVVVILAIVGAPTPPSVDVGPLTIRVDVEPNPAALSDAIRVSLTITSPKGVEIEWPRPGDLAAARWIDQRTEGPDSIGRLLVRRWMGRVEPLSVGPLNLGVLEIRFKEAETDWRTGEIRLPIVEIAPSSASARSSDDLRPPPPLEEPTPPRVGRLLFWVGAAFFLAAATILLATQRRPTRSLEDPLRDAREALEALDGRVEPAEAAERLVGILRGYLEKRYDLPASRRTATELLSDPETRAKLSDRSRRVLCELLREMDVERFAGRAIATGDVERARELASVFFAAEEDRR